MTTVVSTVTLPDGLTLSYAEQGDQSGPALFPYWTPSTIWGDGDGLVGRQMQEQLTELIAGAELLVYSGIGHTPRWEDGARFASDVAAFIERLGRATRS